MEATIKVFLRMSQLPASGARRSTLSRVMTRGFGFDDSEFGVDESEFADSSLIASARAMAVAEFFERSPIIKVASAREM